MRSFTPTASSRSEGSHRSYAIGREAELKQVLQSASNPQDRRAAAILLGYVQRSPIQAEALSQAITDPDSDVRNNAVRALEVLLAATGSAQQIDVTPFIDLLYSGSWTDRNKASMFLFRATEDRNPEILRLLRTKAMGPLVEGASWSNVPGHSTPFLVILARIGGIPNDKIEELLKNGNTEAIISAATAAGEQPTR